MPIKYVLDATALLGFVQDGVAAQIIEEILLEESSSVFMSAMDLGNALYVIQKVCGREAAAALELKVFETRKLQIVDATWKRVKQAAALRAEVGISLAGAFCIGLAQEKEAVLVTCDSELQRLGREGVIPVIMAEIVERAI